MLTIVLFGALGVLGAALSRLVADDMKAWTPKLTRHLVKRAVRILLEQQERHAEEWSAYLDEIPGDLSKIIMAIDLFRAARKEKAQQIFRLQNTLKNTLAAVDSAVEMLSTVTSLSVIVNRVKEQIANIPDNFVFDENFILAKTIIFEFDQQLNDVIAERIKCVNSLLEIKSTLNHALHDAGPFSSNYWVPRASS